MKEGEEVAREPQVLRPFLLVLALMVLLQFSGQGAVIAYTEQIFRDARSSLEASTCSLLVGLTSLASSLLVLVLRPLAPSRLLLLASQLGMALCQLGLGLYLHQLPPLGSPCPWLPLPLLLGFTASYSLGLASLPWLLPTQLLPPTNRAATLTLANITSNLGWFVVLKTFQDLQEYAGLGAPFFLYGGVCVAGLFFIVIFLPEGFGITPGKTHTIFFDLETTRKTKAHSLT